MADDANAVPPLSLAEWAQAETPAKAGPRCWLCLHPDIAEQVHEAANLIRNGAVEITWRQLFQKVGQLYGYPRSESSFVHHCRHHGTDWREE